MEEWKTIQGFPDYQVSNLGRVKSLKFGKEKILESYIRSRYLSVKIDNKNKKIHKLVGLAFLPNPEQKPEIDHINRDKLDNNLTNLRWATRKEQSLNKDSWFIGTNTGEPYISFGKKDKYFHFSKQDKYNKHQKIFKTLDEAVAYRDSILSQIPSSQEV